MSRFLLWLWSWWLLFACSESIIDPELRTNLLELCRETRALGPGYECTSLDSEPFIAFLSALRDTISPNGGNYTDTEDVLHNATDAASWRIHCLAQQKLHDVRTPPICVAAAYAYVPFSIRMHKSNFLNTQTTAIATKAVDNLHLIVVTVDSNYKSHRQPTPRSACMNNVRLHVLGKGIKNFYGKGLGAKVDLFREFLNTLLPLNDSTVVMFVDGSDVIFQKDPSAILKGFAESRAQILFSAEHACYPMKYFPWNLNLGKWLGSCSGACSNSRYVCDILFPVPTPDSMSIGGCDATNRWLNSGGFIGYARNIHNMLVEIATIPTDLLNQWPGFDQGLYTSMFLAGRWQIQLDYHNLIFQSWGLVEDPFEAKDRMITSKNLIEKSPKDDENSQFKWRNSCSKRVPAVLHFNADGKSSGFFKSISKSLFVHSFHYIDGISHRNMTNTKNNHFERKCMNFHKLLPSK